MPLSERDIFGSQFGVGDEVLIRGIVTSVVSASTNAPIPTSGVGGSADRVSVLVDTNSLPGEVVGLTVVVSPVQCRRAQGGISYGPQ